VSIEPLRRTLANVRILKNLLDVLAEAPVLRHITVFQGGKAHGSDIGPALTELFALAILLDVRQHLNVTGMLCAETALEIV
jgi:hypothetical protein